MAATTQHPRAKLAATVGGCALLTLGLVEEPSAWRFGLAVAIAALLIAIGLRWPRAAVCCTFTFLVLVAFIRRLLIADAGWTSIDPLLLVGPVVGLALLARLVAGGRVRLAADPISRLVVGLVAMATIETFNPRGGGLTAGAAGLLFVAAPLVWFFLGRELATPRMIRRLLRLTVLLALPVAAYGLVQSRVGLPSWDAAWFRLNGYEALQVTQDQLRPFGTFASSAEHALFLAVAVVICVGFALHGRLLALVPATPLAVALFLTGTRGPVVMVVAAILLMGGLRAARSLGPALAVTLLGTAAVAIGLPAVAPQSTSQNALVNHEVGGLLHPTDAQDSTLGLHWQLVAQGIEGGLTDPIGRGTAATNLAGQVLGGGSPQQSTSTELDFSNTLVGFGLFGGLLFLALVTCALGQALRGYLEQKDPARLAIAGALVVTLGQWLIGGQYALSPLIWLLVGSTVALGPARQRRRARTLQRVFRGSTQRLPRLAPGVRRPSLSGAAGGGPITLAAAPGAGAPRETLRRTGLHTYTLNALTLAANLVSGVLIARLLGARGRGELTAVMTITAVAVWVFATGCAQAVSYQLARRPGDAARLFATWLAVFVPIGALGVLCSELALPYLLHAQRGEVVSVARLWCFTILLGLLGELVYGMLLGDEKYLQYNVVRFVRPLTISIVYAAAGIFGAFSVNAALLTTLIVDGCVTGMLAVGVIRRHGFARPDRAIARETVSFGLRAHGANVGGIVTARFDLLIMPAILSAASVGVYAVATNVSWIVVSVAGALGPVVLPAAARRGSGHGPRTILPALRATLGIAVVLALVLGAGAGLGVRIVYGHGFGASAPALRLLLPGAICYAGWLVLSSGLQAAGRPLAASLTQLPGVVFTVVGLLLFLRSGGIVAAAVISTIAYASAFLIALVVYRDAARLSWRALVFGRGARGAVAGRRGRWPEAARAR